MRKLPEDFSLEKYGLKVRLVNENDVDFILSLRANFERTKYMLTLNKNIEKQKKWIRRYKKREFEGIDYYFIYTNLEDKPIGLNRVSRINTINKTAKDASLIAIKGLKYEALKMIIIRNEIAFNLLGVKKLWGEVHEKNINAIKIFILFGYEIKDIGKEYLRLSLKKEDFYKAIINNRFLKNLSISNSLLQLF